MPEAAKMVPCFFEQMLFERHKRIEIEMHELLLKIGMHEKKKPSQGTLPDPSKTH